MPRKPSQEVLDAHKAKLNPHDVLQVVINETAELKEAVARDYDSIFGKENNA